MADDLSQQNVIQNQINESLKERSKVLLEHNASLSKQLAIMQQINKLCESSCVENAIKNQAQLADALKEASEKTENLSNSQEKLRKKEKTRMKVKSSYKCQSGGRKRKRGAQR